ncbi:hypothetical protein KC19_1G273400 [Ceratodon purpureus]|uniref:Uncharacterized protein n=1 Tax=Ceratodon purpureus TaxID=3225 RepID=A0A8T0JCD2_CERPU|nr:hypothetical protein KC19_1G273400 [Ceratodon purpureus]
MRYNIVDVLALVIKQDLVEDANIVPGDALRTSLLPNLLLNVILIAQNGLSVRVRTEVKSPAKPIKCSRQKLLLKNFEGECLPSKDHCQLYQPEMVALIMPAGNASDIVYSGVFLSALADSFYVPSC